MPVITGYNWGEGNRDDQGQRTYYLYVRVLANVADGPANVLQTPGLPRPYSIWIIAGDIDIWAWCRWEVDIKPDLTTEPNTGYILKFTFSTKQPDRNSRNNDVQNPLLEPPKISGDFSTYTEEAVVDRFGQPIMTSSFERITGAQVEFDRNRSSVTIEMPFPTLNWSFVSQLIDVVNVVPMWGFPARSVKLSKAPWKKMYQAKVPYYTYTFTFEIRTRINEITGKVEGDWDRDLADEGTKVLHGHWATVGNQRAWVLDNVVDPNTGILGPPSRYVPSNFDKYLDPQGNPSKVLLNLGIPAYALQGMPVQEVQTVTLPIGGPWNLTAPGTTIASGNFFFGSTAEFIQNILNTTWFDEFGNDITDGVSVTGGPAGTNPLVVTFLGAFGQQAIGLMTLGGGAGTVVETTQGSPATAANGPGTVHVEKYQSYNLLLLGVPSSLELP